MEPFVHKRTWLFQYVSAFAGAKHSEAKCDSHLSSPEPGETAAAVEVSLLPDGQSATY